MRISPKLMKLSAAGLVMIALHEGFKDTSYLDTQGVWTIGFGETKGVKKGQKTTVDRELARFYHRMENDFEGPMIECMGDNVKLYQYEYDAYMDFGWNIGIRGFCDSTVVKLLKEGKYKEACEAIMLWKKNPELIRRRKEEVKSCLGE